ncbi:uncharacterized protein TNIN_206061 [Trichonephila inaurata madagascariensis]|uniref:Uncharacterized protein n=1 Tax=Trichonephila inaurata madagascariensis TaxID=2747483 RepID=A0A8X6XQD4_9ARAC|nr:uncharacterized protein TNIN_206061 [Trichonephila inaurata madagascariensis]
MLIRFPKFKVPRPNSLQKYDLEQTLAVYFPWQQDSSKVLRRPRDCNRTYYGLTDLKYPLRLSERRSPTCTLNFIAAGGRYGDRIEITFLSFQIGTFDLDRYMI